MLGRSRVRSRFRFGAAAFNPSGLFASGAQGAWYDPSDLSTLFQDAAGTTAVTAVEQPVRLMRDKSGRSNHATAPNDASRPVLRSRYNLLTFSEQFDNAAWTKSSVTVTANTDTAPNGTLTADTLAATGANGTTLGSLVLVAGSYTFSVWLRRKTGTGNIDISAHSGGTWVTQTITSSWARYTVTQTLTAGTRTPGIWIVTSGDEVYAWGAQLLTAADQTATGGAYQRVAAATDYDTSNPVWRPYLAFDGSDDSMTISSGINNVFQNVGGGTTWAGYNATSAINAVVVFVSSNTSASATRAGVIPNASGGRRLDADSFVSATDSGFAVNNTYVATNVSDWAGGNVIRRTNGVQVASTAYSSGAGNTSNTASLLVSLGANSSPLANFLAGRLYSAIILGRTATASEIASTEAWVAGKTGVTL